MSDDKRSILDLLLLSLQEAAVKGPKSDTLFGFPVIENPEMDRQPPGEIVIGRYEDINKPSRLN
jgi:hypothetical protein